MLAEATQIRYGTSNAEHALDRVKRASSHLWSYLIWHDHCPCLSQVMTGGAASINRSTGGPSVSRRLVTRTLMTGWTHQQVDLDLLTHLCTHTSSGTPSPSGSASSGGSGTTGGRAAGYRGARPPRAKPMSVDACRSAAVYVSTPSSGRPAGVDHNRHHDVHTLVGASGSAEVHASADVNLLVWQPAGRGSA